ncbi:hypothetical protein QJS66_14070 [Kocuria rhizophila]|nr:hypothetical protein QJS66_14070 [Kocuria rhizophila]
MAQAMSPEGLIQDRHHPLPRLDIHLTNYKMLDQLLLRSADGPLWSILPSPCGTWCWMSSTYNGAQEPTWPCSSAGCAWPWNAWPRSAPPWFRRPPPPRWGRAYIARGGFAIPILGTPFTVESVVTNAASHRMPGDAAPERLRSGSVSGIEAADLQAQEHPTLTQLQPVLQLPGAADGARRCPPNSPVARSPCSGRPRKNLAENAEPMLPPTDLFLAISASALCPPWPKPPRPRSRRGPAYLDQAHHRVPARRRGRRASRCARGRQRSSFPNVELHLWTREASDVDRATSPAVALHGVTIGAHDGSFLPATDCRNCGRSGWGVALTGTGDLI